MLPAFPFALTALQMMVKRSFSLYSVILSFVCKLLQHYLIYIHFWDHNQASYHLNGFYFLTYLLLLCQFAPLEPCWHLEISPIGLGLLSEFWLWRSHHLGQTQNEVLLLRICFMLWFQNPKVSKMEFADLHFFLLGIRWTSQAAFIVCLLSPPGVTGSVVLLALIYFPEQRWMWRGILTLEGY